MSFQIENGVLTSCLFTKDSNKLVIPEGVTEIGTRAFSFMKDKCVKSIILPNSLKEIQRNAFRDMSYLTSITIPESVTKIAYGAFFGCTSLTEVTLPKSLTIIEDFVFAECTALTKVTIPDSINKIAKDAFFNTPWLKNYPDDFVISGNQILIKYKGKDKNITVPDGVRVIEENAFRQRKFIKSVTIPESVIRIGNHAFIECTSLTNVKFSDSTTFLFEKNDSENSMEIEQSAFEYCYSLTSINIPKRVVKIGSNAFRKTPWIENQKSDFVIVGKNILFKYNGNDKNLVIPNGVEKIGAGAFDSNCSITNIVIPNSVTEIENYAFEKCSSLTNVKISDSVTNIEMGAFKGCSSLTSINIPEGITEIEWFMFFGCHSLKNITLPESLTKIGIHAFEQCSSLTSVTIPDNVKEISLSAFNNCTALKNITIPDNIEGIMYKAFENCAKNAVVRIFGCEFSLELIDLNNTNLKQIKYILDTNDYSVIMNSDTKCHIIAKIYLKNAQPKAEDFIKKNTVKIFKQFIDLDDYPAIDTLLNSGKFVTKHNIDKIIEYAIQNTQNGGDMQIQILLTSYKYENFGISDTLNDLFV